jgi:glycosyltransferase involved in cell wall biosynthesis
MRIAMVSARQCIRVFKQGLALSNLGHKVIGVTKQLSFGHNLLDGCMVYQNDFELQRTIKAIDPLIDIYHAHNEPDNFVRLIKEITNKPVVWDIHDLESLRKGGVADADEADSMNMADAFVHVSEPCRIYAENSYGNKAPSIVLYSYVNEQFIPDGICKRPSWSTFVYEGGLSVKGFEKDGEIVGTNIRWWYPVFKLLIDSGYNVTVFGAGDDYSDLLYQSLGVALQPNTPYPVMLNGLQPCGFGLVGAFTSFPLMEAAMPNKLFEYISQGVVPVVLNATEVAKFVQENECGVILTQPDHIEEQISIGPKVRQRVLDMRRSLTMENQIHKLVELYRSLL